MPDIVLQKQLTEVFFLFPEFIDEHRQASAPYVRNMEFPHDEHQPEFVSNVVNMLEFFSYEHNLGRYYDKCNLDGMLYPYNEMSYPDVDSQVRSTLRDYDVLNWRDAFDVNETNIVWHDVQIHNDTCAKVYERAHIDTQELLVHATLFSIDGAIETDGDEIVFKKESKDCVLSYQTTLRGLHSWLSEYRIPQRRYTYSEKHGENSKNGRINRWHLSDGTPAAVLKCDSRHAQEVLCKAIGDKSINNNLWYYDDEIQEILYCEYQNESPQNEYHCYHISPRDKGYDKVNVELLRFVQDNIPY